MEVLPATRLLRQCAVHSSFSSAITNLHISPSKKNSELINFAKATRNGDRIPSQEMFELFLSERQATGDIVSKVSDLLWKQELMDVKDTEDETAEESGKVISKEKQSGFLKLSQTKEWVTGINKAPVNQTASISEWKFDSEKRKKMGILEYEALKRELLIITAGIAIACSCYCFISFSPQVALSYGIGAASRLTSFVGFFGDGCDFPSMPLYVSVSSRCIDKSPKRNSFMYKFMSYDPEVIHILSSSKIPLLGFLT